MPLKMSGIAISVIEASSVARSTAKVVFDRAIHLWRWGCEEPVRADEGGESRKALTLATVAGSPRGFGKEWGRECVCGASFELPCPRPPLRPQSPPNRLQAED